jgi:lipase
VATVVLVHGLFGPFADERTMPRLPGHRVVAPPLLGYGGDTTRGATLHDQVEHIHALLGEEPAYVVGHSVGGAVALLYAHRYPGSVLGVVDLEGNFTLADAFWSAELAAMEPVAAEALLESYRADPCAWMDGTDDPERIAFARTMLDFQPAATLQATAASIVAITGSPEWEPTVREVMGSVPVHLVAGSLSRTGWDVPPWALALAASYAEIEGAGHLMMLDRPQELSDLVASLLP